MQVQAHALTKIQGRWKCVFIIVLKVKMVQVCHFGKPVFCHVSELVRFPFATRSCDVECEVVSVQALRVVLNSFFPR